MAEIFVLGVFKDGKRMAQVDFEPDTAKDFRELPFDELAKRYLEPAITQLRNEIAYQETNGPRP